MLIEDEAGAPVLGGPSRPGAGEGIPELVGDEGGPTAVLDGRGRVIKGAHVGFVLG